jgi:hypothetical protein
MSLESAIAELEAGQSHQQMLNQLRARMVYKMGLAQSGYVLGYLASIGKLKIIRSVAANDDHPLSNAADATLVTLQYREGFDFTLPANIVLLDAFVQAGILDADQANVVVGIGSKSVPEFENLTLKQVVAVREPALVNQSESNIVDVVAKKGHQQLLIVTVGDGLPEAVNLQFQVRNKFGDVWSEWEGSSVVGLTNKQTAGIYSARLPGDLIKSDESQIKIVCPYAITVTLTVE